jgi:glucose-6-phosphate dehydrogenase assembly protein OpcA
MDPQLWAWVDRLIYDSQPWHDFHAQMQLVETAQSEAKQRVVLCDLNWTRLVHTRLAIAQFFDHPSSHHHFNEIKRAEIDFAPGYQSTGLLLLGWIAAQLQWKLAAQQNNMFHFRNAAGGRIEVQLEEQKGEPIGRCLLRSGDVEFLVVHLLGTDLLDVSYGGSGGRRTQQVMPAGGSDDVHLVSEELFRGGPHRVYLRALNCIRDLL